MIRVLHYGLDSKLGGIETYLHKLYTNIDRNEFKFDFLCIGDEEPCWYKEFTNMGSDFYNVTPRNVNPMKNKKEIYDLLKNEKFDIVHCHLNTLSYITPVLAAIENDIPVIVHSRNAGAVKSKLSNLMHRINSKRLPKDKIVKLAVSGLAGEWLFGKDEECTVINNGLDIEKYKFDNNARIRVREEFNIKESELLITHLGAMREQKNHKFIIDIFNEVLNMNKDAKLLLVGDGELKNQILEKIKELNIGDKVILAGKRDDVRDILCAGDIFLFPSFFEGFPNAVLEAQTTGLPCLISNKITSEVMINEDCKAMNINIEPKLWAEELLSFKLDKRRDLISNTIKNKGYAVEDEVKRISKIYQELKR